MSNKYLNRSNTTATQFMEGYPTKAGDATHLRAITYDALGTLKKDYSHSTGSAWLGANASDRYEAVSDLGTSFVFSTLAVTLEHNQTAWVVRGTNLELWYFGNLIESKDITGETFTLDRYGASANSATGGTEWKHIYPTALTASDIEWFSYLRNQDTNKILLPPIFPDPIPPIVGPTIYQVNSATFVRNSSYFSKTNTTSGATSFAVSAWIRRSETGVYHTIYRANHNGNQNAFTVYVESANDYVHVYDGDDFAIDSSVLAQDQNYHIVGEFVGGSHIKLWVNGVLVSNNTTGIKSSLDIDGVDPNCGIGVGLKNTPNLGLNGNITQLIEFKNHGGLSQANVDELFGSTPNTYKCINEYSAPLKAMMTSGYQLAEWTGNTGNAKVDQIGSDDLVETGTVTYVDQGLEVECN